MHDGGTATLDLMSSALLIMASRRRMEEETNEDEDPCAGVTTGDYDQGLHVASIFIIFVISGIGVGLPLLSKHSRTINIHPYIIVLGKCAGIGVMLSCALVHMILPSNESLTSECVSSFFNTTYPAFAFFFALMAALSVHLGEFLLTASLQGLESSADDTQEVEKNEDGIENEDEDGNDADNGSPRKGEELDVKDPQEDKAAFLKAKHLSEAIMVEFSLSVHSVLIGVAVGVSDRDTLVTLLIALVFHQMFEGVALGARLVDGTIGYRNEVMFALIFAMSAPLGIVIGISIYRTFNENGESFLMIQGVFDGICGGILLYTGFLMLFTDFPEDLEKHCRGKNRRRMVAGMFATLWIAAMLMSLIGGWL